MQKTKAALINDTHHGVRNDHELFDEHISSFYRDILFLYIDQHDISHIIHLGDVFDRRKYINFRTAHSFRQNFLAPVLERIDQRGLTIDFLAGNHDTYFKTCLLYTSPSPRDLSTSRMPSSA